jgi:hypothetical protein
MNKQFLKKFMGIFTLLLFLVAAGCKDKNTVGTAATISGTDSKTWKATRETNASGDKDKITGAEKQQEIQFFQNGSFSMRSASENASGKWTYDPMGKSLQMQFVGSDMTENFQVLSLTDDEMKLQGSNGTMTLEAQ